MCGIAGFFGLAGAEVEPYLNGMAMSLRHRGPDAQSLWTDADHGIGLAHSRLAILDLSPHGAQPMISADGRYVVCFNGEIYNHAELRNKLAARQAIQWRGHSDTEVLVEAMAAWGVEQALARLNGMFAFAVWDRHERQLTLARDRMGEKPLYIGWVAGMLGFASELKALRCLPGWHHTVDRDALASLLRFGYIPAPLSIHKGIFKLPAASLVNFRARDVSAPMTMAAFVARTKCYWGLSSVAEGGDAALFRGDEMAAMTELDALLSESVRLRMEADVPLGSLLSGGVDSSLVAALMQRTSSRPVRTYSIGFGEGRFDEAQHARRVASYLGTDHCEMRVTPLDALDVIPELPDIYDEPFADPSQIPTVLVSRMARQHVKVALSGDGGDELFFGYARYADAVRIWGQIGAWPKGMRRGLATALEVTGGLIGNRLGFRLSRLGRRTKANDFDAYYANLLSFTLTPTGFSGCHPASSDIKIPECLADPTRRMMFTDQLSYLPENIFTKTDRASMAASLELRAPLLDHRLVEFTWRLPEAYHWDGHKGKMLLRQLLYQLVPKEIVDRPKQGFEIPLNEWLRGPLRNWMHDLLNPAALRQDGYLDADRIGRLVSEHARNRADHGYALWPVLMFQAWQNRYR